jgi:hypothetical protein
MSDPKIGWKVREYSGTEIYRNKEDLEAGRRMLEPPKAGDEILVPTLSGWAKAVVKKDGELYAEAGRFTWPLALSDDDRHCWVAHGMINMAALEKLKLKG